MVISGLRSKSIYPQNKINWAADFNFLPNTGNNSFSFGFSGGNENYLEVFKLKNNKIYDKDGLLISNYSNNINTNFSGNIAESGYSLYKNGTSLFDNKFKNSFPISSFVLNTDGSFVNFNNLKILGTRPEFFISSTPTVFSNFQINIPIAIYNNGLSPFYIYSGYTYNTNFSVFIPEQILVNPSSSGVFNLINNNLYEGTANVPITLYTNIGNLDLTVNLNGSKNNLNNDIYYYSFGPEAYTIDNNITGKYGLNFYSKSGSNVSISFTYISGTTGSFYKFYQVLNIIENIPVSGIISGTGFLNSDLQIGIVEKLNLLNNEIETGLGSGYINKYKIAEDQIVSYDYQALATGLGNGYLLTNIPASGHQSNIKYSGYLSYLGGVVTGYAFGNITGTVPDAKAGWIYNEYGDFLPPVISQNGINIICKYRPELSICNVGTESNNFIYKRESGYASGISTFYSQYTGKIFLDYSPSDYNEINLKSSLLFVTGNFSGLFDIIGGAYATGGRISGKILGDFAQYFEPGLWTFSKPWGGAITGESFLTWTGTGFNPITAEYLTEITTGLFVGTISSSGFLNFCNPEIPQNLTVSGIPNFVKKLDSKDRSIYSNQLAAPFILTPNLYFEESKYENSNFLITGGDARLYNEYPSGGRTRISRLGNTPSGSGKFDNLFQITGFTGLYFQYTGENGELLYQDKLDSFGQKIPKYSSIYQCMPLTGSNGLPITGADGNPITGSDGNFVPQPLLTSNGTPILRQVIDTNGDPIYDENGNPVIDYVCQPFLGLDGKPVYLPQKDANGNIIYDKIPIDEYIATGFWGWKETLEVIPSTYYETGIPPSIQNIQAKCYLSDSCDVSIINFIVKKPTFYFSGEDTSINETSFTGCFSGWPLRVFENITSGIIFGYDSFASVSATPYNKIKINISNDGLRYFKFTGIATSSSSSSN
jgi:hypothetical protein